MRFTAAVTTALVLGLLAPAASFAAIPSSERAALIAIHDAMGGPEWTSRGGWLDAPGTECLWYGVSCNEGETTVIGLDLSYQNVAGAIPATIRNLPNLVELALSGNAVTGPIPAEIGQLADLEHLRLDFNFIDGTIPATIGSLSELRSLRLSYNALSGTIPPGIGNLSSLEELGLALNFLEGSIPPSIGQLLQLEGLDLYGNELTGAIPAGIATLPALFYVDLSMNALSGPLPSNLGALGALEGFHVYGNQLEGTIPPSLANSPNLRTLGLESNRFTGPIPPELGSLSQLELLDLSGNLLEGPIPPSLGNLGSLLYLGLGDNRFSGSIPRELGQIDSLLELSLWGNQLTGSIPSELGQLEKLEVLYLGINQLAGSLPRELGNLANLRALHAGDNLLTGSIPPELGNLAKLEELTFHFNQLTGPIPASLGNLASLMYLDLTANALSGPIPESITNLGNLIQLTICCNELTGSIPQSIGNLTNLELLLADHNRLTGPLPPSLWNLERLTYLALQDNRLTGPISPAIGNFRDLAFLEIGNNDFEGAIPDSLWTLENLIWIGLDNLGLTGAFPAELGQLSSLEVLILQNNRMSGPIPPSIGDLAELFVFSVDGNRFTGTVPAELGKLDKVLELDISNNALRGELPRGLLGLTGLPDQSADFGFNVFTLNDPELRTFLDRKQNYLTVEASQTTTPTGLRLLSTTDRSAALEWNPIRYIDDGGGYRVTATGGGRTVVATTHSKEITSIVVRELSPLTTYSFTVAAVTHPHGFQPNLLTSDPSAPITATTGPPVVAPAEVVVTSIPSGMIQIDGDPRNEDSFALTNYGDTPTTIELFLEEDFFTVEPATFALAGGATRTITIRSVAGRPVGAYWGVIYPSGAGVDEETYIPVTLLSVARPAGTVVGEAVTSRVEVSGLPGSDSIGTAVFRNAGTAALEGVLVADVPWLIPPDDSVYIGPSEIYPINFTVRRSLRPADAQDGTLIGHLELVYVAGDEGSDEGSGDVAKRPFDSHTTGVSRTVVQVVDLARPGVTTGPVPALAEGEVAFFLAGMVNRGTPQGSVVSDLGIANLSGSAGIGDLRLYFTSGSAASASIASMSALPESTAVSLANPIRNVYESAAGSGTIQVRTANWRNLLLRGQLLGLAEGIGAFPGELPVFRSDRSVSGSEEVFLAGIETSTGQRSVIIIQETGGGSGSATIEFLRIDGGSIATRTEPIAAFGTLELSDAVPSGATAAIVRASGGASIAAWARMEDPRTGDRWGVVDWSRQYRFPRTSTVRIPLVETTSEGGIEPVRRRRRPVRRGESGSSVEATGAAGQTAVWLFNPSIAPTRVAIESRGASGERRNAEVTIEPRATAAIPDLMALLGAAPGDGFAVLEPSGSLVVTARASADGRGTSLPSIAASSGLRLGQSQTFSGIEDSRASASVARSPGTYRTSLTLMESGGASAKVRATLLLPSGRRLNAMVFRDFDLAPNGVIVADRLAASILGPTRETAYPDLHDLQLLLEVVGGDGAVVPMLKVVENATGDSSVRLE